MKQNTSKKKQPRSISSTQSLSAFVKSICDIMRRSNCASALYLSKRSSSTGRAPPSSQTA